MLFSQIVRRFSIKNVYSKLPSKINVTLHDFSVGIVVYKDQVTASILGYCVVI